MVSASGLVQFLRIGGFELRDIGYIYFNSVTKKSSVTISVCDIRLNTVFQHVVKIRNESGLFSFFYNDILPFLRLVDEYGSYKSYQQSIELASLKEENEMLKLRLKQFEKAIDVK
jgi:hypothetical protein